MKAKVATRIAPEVGKFDKRKFLFLLGGKKINIYSTGETPVTVVK